MRAVGPIPRGLAMKRRTPCGVENVLVSVLADLLTNDETSPQEARDDLAQAMLAAGYPADAVEVTAADAVGILEWLDSGIVRSTHEQRAERRG